ncbi:hypothetical protein GCM10010178_17860 [Lentzea flava]|uniref:Uncharacterized protein n=1 Tax=Lentzea flava TaxID=103732 RepID=A0ABQ2UE00_9PSEU|nr:hypothetical protein GCM10010178_17860 [Lentzea flava]
MTVPKGWRGPKEGLEADLVPGRGRLVMGGVGGATQVRLPHADRLVKLGSASGGVRAHTDHRAGCVWRYKRSRLSPVQTSGSRTKREAHA